jgi:glycine cleavage system regulatory protein
MLVFDYGAFFVWGDNEKGQMGDRSRKMIESPFPKAKFELKHNVLNVEAHYDNCAVVVERLSDDIKDKDDEDEKRRMKKSKRQAKQIQHAPKMIVVDAKQLGFFAKIKERVTRLLRARKMEVEKMKEIKQIKEEVADKTDEQYLFDEVTKNSNSEAKPKDGK